jgi:hypothetical protein
MADEIKDLKKLSPEQRIKKLKEMQEKHKKEIEEAQKMMKISEDELDEENRLKEQIQVPDISTTTAKKIFEKSLEDTVAKEKPKISEEELREIEKTQYIEQLSKEPMKSLYNEIKALADEVKNIGEIDDYQRHRLYDLRNAVDKKHDAIAAGEYRPEKEYIRKEVDATQRLLDEVLGDSYKR